MLNVELFILKYLLNYANFVYTFYSSFLVVVTYNHKYKLNFSYIICYLLLVIFNFFAKKFTLVSFYHSFSCILNLFFSYGQ